MHMGMRYCMHDDVSLVEVLHAYVAGKKYCMHVGLV